jgi:O-antigen/teichoic acid export membrane protein
VLKKYFERYKLYIKSASFYLIATVITSAVKVLINPLLASNLSHEDYAIIGYFGSFSLLLLPLINFSIVTYYMRNYYLLKENKRAKVENTIVISLFGIGFISSFFVLLALNLYFKLTSVHFPFWPFAFYTVFQIVFNNFLTLLQVNYRLKREAKKFVLLSTFSAIIWLFATILLVVVFKLGAKGSMAANLTVAFLLGIYSIEKMLTRLEFDYAIFKDALKFCWPLVLSSILWYFLSGVDRLMLEKLDDNNTFALYNIGVTISGFLAMFYMAIAQTFEPDIYKAISDKKLKKLLTIIVGIVIINAIPVIVFILFSKPLTSLLTAGRYTDAAPFASIISLKNITTSFYYSVIAVIVGFGFTKEELGLRAIGAIVCVAMFNLLIDRYGFYGAAWGQVFSFLIMSIFGMFFLLYKIKTKSLYAKC